LVTATRRVQLDPRQARHSRCRGHRSRHVLPAHLRNATQVSRSSSRSVARFVFLLLGSGRGPHCIVVRRTGPTQTTGKMEDKLSCFSVDLKTAAASSSVLRSEDVRDSLCQTSCHRQRATVPPPPRGASVVRGSDDVGDCGRKKQAVRKPNLPIKTLKEILLLLHDRTSVGT
jgi:hypothetical protein